MTTAYPYHQTFPEQFDAAVNDALGNFAAFLYQRGQNPPPLDEHRIDAFRSVFADVFDTGCQLGVDRLRPLATAMDELLGEDGGPE